MCRKHPTLKLLDLKNLNNESLQNLLNMNNHLNAKEVPILMSKMVVKFGLNFACKKFPSLGTYVNPEDLLVRVEDDERQCLHNSQKSSTPASIVFVVCKNMVISLCGKSLNEFKNKFEDFIPEENIISVENENKSKFPNFKANGNLTTEQINEKLAQDHKDRRSHSRLSLLMNKYRNINSTDEMFYHKRKEADLDMNVTQSVSQEGSINLDINNAHDNQQENVDLDINKPQEGSAELDTLSSYGSQEGSVLDLSIKSIRDEDTDSDLTSCTDSDDDVKSVAEDTLNVTEDNFMSLVATNDDDEW